MRNRCNVGERPAAASREEPYLRSFFRNVEVRPLIIIDNDFVRRQESAFLKCPLIGFFHLAGVLQPFFRKLREVACNLQCFAFAHDSQQITSVCEYSNAPTTGETVRRASHDHEQCCACRRTIQLRLLHSLCRRELHIAHID
jgi:hypothetical protein